MKHSRKILFGSKQNKKMKVSDRAIKRVMDFQMWFSKFHYTFKTQGSKCLGRAKNEKQKAMDISYNFCEPADLRDKYFSHEHHDLIVGKDYRGIF
jgi:hypothetical protein